MTRKKIFRSYSVLLLIYALLTLAAPADQASLHKYGLSVLQSKLLSLSILIPLAGIWFAAFYGSSKLKEYAASIKRTPEGKAFDYLANGLLVLAFGLTISSIASSVLNLAVRNNPGILPITVIFRNYLTLVVALIGFVLIDKGAKYLAHTAKAKTSLTMSVILKIALLALATAYSYIVLNDPARQVAAVAGGRAAYYLPDWLIISTIIIPYLYVWYTGLGAGLLVNLYRRNVEGVIYKQFLGYFALGIVSIIFSQIFLQILGSYGSSLAGLGLAAILAIVYVLLAVIAVGYVLVALGAKKLTKIEEV